MVPGLLLGMELLGRVGGHGRALAVAWVSREEDPNVAGREHEEGPSDCSVSEHKSRGI